MFSDFLFYNVFINRRLNLDLCQHNLKLIIKRKLNLDLCEQNLKIINIRQNILQMNIKIIKLINFINWDNEYLINTNKKAILIFNFHRE